MGQIELKRMLINTLFEGTLTYNKELDIIQTISIPSIYKIFNGTNDEYDLYNIKSQINKMSIYEKSTQTS